MNTQPHPILPQMLSIKQAAQQIGVSVRTFYRMMADGQFPPAKKIRGRSVVPVQFVYDYLNKLCQP